VLLVLKAKVEEILSNLYFGTNSYSNACGQSFNVQICGLVVHRILTMTLKFDLISLCILTV